MKKVFLILGLVCCTLKPVENDIFSLTNELEKFVAENKVAIQEQEWDKIRDTFKSYSEDQRVLGMYKILTIRFPIINKLDEIVEANKGWSYIKNFGLENAKVQLVKENRAKGSIDFQLSPNFEKQFDEALDKASAPECDSVERKSIEETFELLVVLTKK